MTRYMAEALENRRMLIVSGETITSTISAAAEQDDYTFTANIGDAVIAGVMETTAASPLTPRITLLAPGGTQIFSVTGTVGTVASSFNLAAAGTYTLRITDNANTQTGGYAVSLAKLPGAQTNSGDGGALVSGEYKSGSFTVGDLDVYTINGTAGGSLTAFAGETDGQTIDTAMNIVGPNGQNIFGNTNPGVVSTTETPLPATGTYYIVVYDSGFNATGNYNLTVISNPATQVVDADSGPAVSGVRRTGTIGSADADVFTITTPVNGNLIISLSEVNPPSSSFNAALQVFSPTGALLFNQAGTVGREYYLQNTAAGTYTFVVYEQSSDAVGDYAITAVVTPGAQPTDADSGPIASGEYKTGSFDTGDIDVYTIAGTAGGSLVATIAETANAAPIDVVLRVFSPTGAQLFSNSGVVAIATALNALPATGTYTIVVNDGGADAVGAYALTVASVPASTPITDADSVTLASGVRRTGTLDMGDMDVYTINVPINGNLFVAMSEDPSVPAAFNPQLIVVGPNGAILFNQAGTIGRDYFLPNATSGTYTIMAIEQFQDAAGGYALTAVAGLASQPTDADSGPATSGVYYTGTIDTGDIDVYTITGTTGGSLLLNFAETTAALSPAIVVTAPNGSVLVATSGTVGLPQLFTNLPATGTYTVAINDAGADATGGYGITLVTAPAASQPTDADSGPITSGAYRSGTLDMGDIDVFTLNVNLGSSFVVTVAEQAVGTFNPQLIVFSPSGASLSNTIGTIGTGTLQVNLAAAGTYTICVLDQSGDDLGAYNLTAVNGTGAQITDVDSAALGFSDYRQGIIDPGDIDVYTINATAGSALGLVLNESEYLGPSGVGELGFAIFAPNGSQLRTGTTATGFSSLDTALAATGTYTIAVWESGVDEYMRYGLTLNSTGAAFAAVDDGAALASGETRRGRLDYGDIDVFSVSATAGQSLFISLSDANVNSLTPNIVVAAPNGSILINTASADGLNFRSDSLAATGVYKIYVNDSGGEDTGEYAITATLTGVAQPTTGDSGPLTTTPRTGDIAIGDIDVFTVAASAGVNFSVTVNETPTGQTFVPRVVIYRPDGTVFTDTVIANNGTLSVTSVVAGTYTVIVTESGANASGNYSIALGATNAVTTDTVAPRIVEAAYRYDRPQPELVVYASDNVSASLQATDFVLSNTTTSTVIPTGALSITYDAITNKITIGTPGLFGGILPNGNYNLRLTGSQISDASGNLLDGNGDGTGGDNYNFSFFVLAGDLNRDRAVGFDDLLTVAQNYGRLGMSYSQGNINYDTSGAVNFDDLLIVAQNYGVSVFSGSPIAPPAEPTQSQRTIGRVVDDVLA